jgi:sterol 3beta-glucosyltransferase
VNTAIQTIYRDLEYAKSLIKNRDGKAPDDAGEESEESWTFVGDENDTDLASLTTRWQAMARSGTLNESLLGSGASGELTERVPA